MFSKVLPTAPHKGPPTPNGFAFTWRRLRQTAFSYLNGAVHLISPIPGVDRTLPDAVYLLYKSISIAAADATLCRGILERWVLALDRQVSATGKFPQWEVMYANVNPPPVFWDYKCYKCRAWFEPNGCQWVEGDISPQGWCVIWVPPLSYKPFVWPKELIKGDW